METAAILETAVILDPENPEQCPNSLKVHGLLFMEFISGEAPGDESAVSGFFLYIYHIYIYAHTHISIYI